MRVPLVLLSFLPFLLSLCPDEEEERERERQSDEELRGCRSCSMISILADENCLVGYECNAEWKIMSNVLSPNECACSELKCADPNATLVINGDRVGKIRCKDNEWTLPGDQSTPATSAVCAKSCGRRACQARPPKVTDPHLYSELDVKDPIGAETCARAECPKGIAVFNDKGALKKLLTEITSLVCSSSGKWKIDGDEEQYAMCLGCGKGVCELKHPHVKEPFYSELPVTYPTDPSICASAACPHGIAVFEDDGDVKFIELDYGIIPLECTNNGKWNLEGIKERYIMCIECMCKTDDAKLTDGQRGACRPGRLCTLPLTKEGDTCEVKCPENSDPHYLDAEGSMESANSIRCAGTDWITVGVKDVTCEYDTGYGHSPNPSGTCSPLPEMDCPSVGHCNYAELVYTPYKDGSRAVCKSGVLVTDKTPMGKEMVADCDGAGIWTAGGETISTGTCVTNGDVSMKDCKEAVLSGPNTFTVSCELGACTFICADPYTHFEYDLGATTGIKSEYVKCLGNKLRSVYLQEIENVKCVT